MANLRFIVVVAALAVCASQANAWSLPSLRSGVSVGVSLEKQLAGVAKQAVSGNSVNDALEKLKEIVENIKEKVVQAEEDLKNALQNGSLVVVSKINQAINKTTGVDLNLTEKWEDLEEKVANCSESIMSPELKTLVSNIKEEAQNCAGVQIADALAIQQQLAEMAQTLQTVPVVAYNNIQNCTGSNLAINNSTSDVTVNNSTINVTVNSTGETNLGPWAPSDLLAGDININALSVSLPDLDTVQCVGKELIDAAKGLKGLPKLAYQLSKEIKELTSNKSVKTLQTCAAKIVSSSGTKLQTAAAQLAACVIAPSA